MDDQQTTVHSAKVFLQKWSVYRYLQCSHTRMLRKHSTVYYQWQPSFHSFSSFRFIIHLIHRTVVRNLLHPTVVIEYGWTRSEKTLSWGCTTTVVVVPDVYDRRCCRQWKGMYDQEKTEEEPIGESGLHLIRNEGDYWNKKNTHTSPWYTMSD